VSAAEGRTPRSVVVAGAFLAAVAVVSALPDRGSGTDSPSSSYSTGPTGSGAYAELLRRFDHPVRRIRGGLDRASFEPTSTLVILDAHLTDDEVRDVGRFVRSGGRLVAGGAGAEEWLEEVVDDPPRFDETPVDAATPAGGAAEGEGIGVVRLGGQGSFGRPGSLQPLLTERGGAALVALAGDVGAGRVVALADPTPLQNHLLGVADNAGFGLAVAGPAGTPVAFAEGPHGYGTGEGLSALPHRWRVALAGLALSAAVWLVSRSRRLGPPEDEARPLGPRRRDYVDALAATLGRTGRPAEAAEPVRIRARSLVAVRAGLPPDAPDDALRAAAARLGLPADEAEALVGTHGEPGVLAAGRALARLEPGARPGELGARGVHEEIGDRP
jgi:hypothetical protein